MATKQQWTVHHLTAFLLTFFSYACFHATRKAFSNVKDVMQKEWTYYNNTNPLKPEYLWEKRHFFKDEKDAEVFLGAMDTAFLSAYALGLYISGIIGDRFSLRKLLAFGMCSSAVLVFMFGTVSKWLGIYNIWYYGVFMALNGLLQSTGWPCVVAVMGNWFGKSSRGIVMGLWSANASVGNIIGALQVAAVLDYGYEYAMLVPATALFLFGIIIFLCLVPSPDEIGLPLPEDDAQPFQANSASAEGLGQAEGLAFSSHTALLSREMSVITDNLFHDRELVISSDEDLGAEGDVFLPRQHGFNDYSVEPHSLPNRAPYHLPETLFQSSSASSNRPDAKPQQKEAISFFRAIFLPGVIPYSLSYACLKLVNYSFFFWLPYYLSNKFGWKDTTADDISTFYDVGGIVGGIIGGVISDRMRSRTPVVLLLLLFSVPMLLVYGNTGGTYTINATLMCITGFFIGGPANLISGAISADLGRQSAISSSEALATVTGIVDGTGSVGAAIGQLLVPEINTHSGWNAVFHFLMVLMSLSLVCIALPPLYKLARKTLSNPPLPEYNPQVYATINPQES